MDTLLAILRSRAATTLLCTVCLVCCGIQLVSLYIAQPYQDEADWTSVRFYNRASSYDYAPDYAPDFLANLSARQNRTALQLSIFYEADVVWRHRRWEKLIANQLMDLEKNGLVNQATLYVCLHAETLGLLQKAIHVVRGVNHRAIIIPAGGPRGLSCSLLMWQLSKALPRDVAERHLILHFHAKDANENGALIRTRKELLLFEKVIDPWRDIVTLFAEHDEVNRAGFVTLNGIVWENFFWTRMSVMQNLTPPEVQTEKDYYEFWLGSHDIFNVPLTFDPLLAVFSAEMGFETADWGVHVRTCAGDVSLHCSLFDNPDADYVIGQCTSRQNFDNWRETMSPYSLGECRCDLHTCGSFSDVTLQ